jgi:hypothetical protein
MKPGAVPSTNAAMRAPGLTTQADAYGQLQPGKIANREFGELFSDKQRWLLNRQAISVRRDSDERQSRLFRQFIDCILQTR